MEKGQFMKKLHLPKRQEPPSPNFGEADFGEKTIFRKHGKQFNK
jgi:hypothetical protein